MNDAGKVVASTSAAPNVMVGAGKDAAPLHHARAGAGNCAEFAEFELGDVAV